jgi:hypothetical protein
LTIEAEVLREYIDQVDAQKAQIAQRWIEDETVIAIFHQYEIAPVKFKENFGIPIIDYFIGVVRGEQKPGNCPIMTKLVNFLLAKHIVPKEVFIICMGFRRELIDALFGMQCRDMRQVMSEVAALFNANLAGVLDIFEKAFSDQRQKMENLLGQDKKFKQILKIINSVKAKIAIVSEGRSLIMNQPMMNAVGISSVKELEQRYENGRWGFVKSIDYNSELFHKAFDVWLKQACDTGETFKLVLYHTARGENVTLSGVVTEIPDTSPTQYAVTMYDASAYAGAAQSEASAPKTVAYETTGDDAVMDEGLLPCVSFEKRVKQVKDDDPSISARYAFILIESRKKQFSDDNLAKLQGVLERVSEEGALLGEIEPKVFGVFWKTRSIEAAYNKALAYEKYLMEFETVLGLTLSPKPERAKKMIARGYDLVDSLEYGSLRRLTTDNKEIRAIQESLIVREKIYAELQDVDSIGLTLLYEELPVNVVNQIVSNELGKLTVLMDKKQIGIMKPGSTVYFLVDSIGFIKGDISQVDRGMMRATIEKMRTEADSPLRRKSIRVEATEGMRGRIKCENIQVIGDVVDVNEHSIGLKIEDVEGLELGKDLIYQMDLPLEGKSVDFSAPGLLRRIHRFGEDDYIVVIECRLEGQSSDQLKQYVAARQMEIIMEMRKLHSGK